jgi:hypothetical protein
MTMIGEAQSSECYILAKTVTTERPVLADSVEKVGPSRLPAY